VPLQADYQTTLRLFPDVSLELLLNKTGSIKATFFYKQSVDYMSATSSPGAGIAPKRYGASISYGREFDRIGELFGKKQPRPIKITGDSTQKPAVDSTISGTH